MSAQPLTQEKCPQPTRSRVLLASVLLSLPLLLMHVGYWAVLNAEDLHYTGYVQYDQPYYVVLAVQYFHEGAHLHAANVFGPDASPARIYFLLPLFIAGAVQALTGLPPALVQNALGWVATVFVFYNLIRLCERLIAVRGWAGWLSVLCFAWGGGFFALAGYLAISVRDLPFQQLFLFDPFNGFWFLNLGRNMVFPTEAFYHLLFVLLLRFLLGGRHGAALITLVLVMLSSPFTGLHALCFGVGWFILEKLVFQRKTTPWWPMAASLALLAFHLVFYLVILPRDELHKVVHAQNVFDWQLDTLPMLLAYSLPGAFAVAGVWRLGARRLEFLQNRAVRLGLVLFGISFGLANNEMLLSDPIQPLHFTRGYLWTGLMIAGLPMVHALFHRLARLSRPINLLAVTTLCAVFLADNLLWLTTLPVYRRQPVAALTPSEKGVLDWFGDNVAGRADKPLVLWTNPGASMILYTRTHLRSWRAHEFVTPYSDRRAAELQAALGDAQLTEQMRRHDLYAVLTGAQAAHFLGRYKNRYPEAPSPEIVHTTGALGIIHIPPSL